MNTATKNYHSALINLYDDNWENDEARNLVMTTYDALDCDTKDLLRLQANAEVCDIISE